MGKWDRVNNAAILNRSNVEIDWARNMLVTTVNNLSGRISKEGREAAQRILEDLLIFEMATRKALRDAEKEINLEMTKGDEDGKS